MAGNNTIATAAIALIPSTSGITAKIRDEFKDVGKLINNILEASMKSAASAGASAISSELRSAANGIGGTISSELQSAGAQGTSQIQGDLDGLTLPVSDMQRQMGQATENGAERGFVSGVKSAGPAILAAIATLGIGAVIGKGIGDAISHQDIGNRMAGAMMLSPDQKKKVDDATRSLYQNGYGGSFEEAALAVEGSISAFTNLRNGATKEIELITSKALNMAAAFEVDVAYSTQVASQMMKNGLSKDAVTAMDTLSTGMQQVPAALRVNLLEAMDEYGPFMRQLGYSGEEAMAMLVTASKKGQYGIDKTGDSLKEFTLLATDGSLAGLLMTDLGFSPAEMSQFMEDINTGGEVAQKAMLKVRDEIMAIDNQLYRKNLAVSFFGVPLEDLNLSEVDDFLKGLSVGDDALGNTEMFAAELDKNLASGLASTISQFKASLEIGAADAMLPILTELQPKLAEATTWIKENQDEIGVWFRQTADAVQNTLVPALEYIIPIASDFAKWINENKDAVKAWIPVIITVAGVLAGLSIINTIVAPIAGLVTFLWASVPAWWAAAAGVSAFGLGLLPLIGIIAGVLAIGLALGTGIYLLVSNFDEVGRAISGFFQGMFDNFDALVNGGYSVMGVIGGVIMGIGVMIANGLIGIVNLVPYAINAMLMAVNGILDLANLNMQIGMIPTIPYLDFSIPALATGAEITGPTVALVGEKDPEYVVNRGKMNAMMDAVTADIANNSGGKETVVINNDFKLVRENGETDQEFAERIARVISWKQRR